MQKILATTVDERGFQIRDVPLVVMTEEDAILLENQSEADMEVHSAVAARFEALESKVSFLSTVVERLVKLLEALESKDRRLK